MIPIHQHNTDVTVTAAYPAPGDAVIEPTAISYVVSDELGTEIVPLTSLTVVNGETEVSVTVDADFNEVTAGYGRAMRVVSFIFTAPSGEYTVNVRYVIEEASVLSLIDNTFQTFEQAALTRMELPLLDGWDVADERNQTAALITAHDRMCRLQYRYRIGMDTIAYDVDDPYWSITSIREITPNEYATFPETFKRALRRAQVYEADQILKGDPVGDKRRSGVVSETIGESKMFFNSRPPLRLALCVSAMEVLGPYLQSKRRIGRA